MKLIFQAIKRVKLILWESVKELSLGLLSLQIYYYLFDRLIFNAKDSSNQAERRYLLKIEDIPTPMYTTRGRNFPIVFFLSTDCCFFLFFYLLIIIIIATTISYRTITGTNFNASEMYFGFNEEF